MYRNVPTRRLGDPITDALTQAGSLNDPVSISVSPLMLGGLGLLALAFVLSGTKKAAGAVSRKSRAIGKALKA